MLARAMAKNTGELLQRLRDLMKTNEVAAYLVPMEDAHQVTVPDCQGDW